MNERETFLSDIIICAIEGGIGYWAGTLNYRAEGRQIVSLERLAAAGETTAIIQDIEDEQARTYTITPSVIEQGIARLLTGDVSYPFITRTILADADDCNDAGLIDADMADDIVQAALLGEIRYG